MKFSPVSFTDLNLVLSKLILDVFYGFLIPLTLPPSSNIVESSSSLKKRKSKKKVLNNFVSPRFPVGMKTVTI